jgi:hypothetical protein
MAVRMVDTIIIGVTEVDFRAIEAFARNRQEDTTGLLHLGPSVARVNVIVKYI